MKSVLGLYLFLLGENTIIVVANNSLTLWQRWGDGIICSILGAVSYAVIIILFKKIIYPKIMEFRYTGTKIDGKWTAYYTGNPNSIGMIEFKQVGNKIRGKSKVHMSRNNESVYREYICEGYFLEHSIILNFKDMNRKALYGGCMTFHIADSDGRIMKGKSIFYKQERNTVDCAEIELHRIPPN